MSFIDKHLNDYTLMNYKTQTLVNLGYTLGQIIKKEHNFMYIIHGALFKLPKISSLTLTCQQG